jgi:aspartate/methionine/tyrosine aminotransferase
MGGSVTQGWEVPPYPYDLLSELKELAEKRSAGMGLEQLVDVSVGDPCDEPPEIVRHALAEARGLRSYPASAGTVGLREAFAAYMLRRFDVSLEVSQVAVCTGLKELIGGLPGWLHLLRPDRDTVLYPRVGYPTYEMGARLAGLRPLAVAVDASGHMDLDAVSSKDAQRALVVYVNSPSNPTGALLDLKTVVDWGRMHGVTVVSDEAYAELTWEGKPRSALAWGEEGVLSLHSLSKRSSLAGLRCGCYCGDRSLVAHLVEIRRHAGLMASGPAQYAAQVAWSDDAHVEPQRQRYKRRLELLVSLARAAGAEASMPQGGIYVWAKGRPEEDLADWALARRLASGCGLVGAPGSLYGEAPGLHVRLAAVVEESKLLELTQR